MIDFMTRPIESLSDTAICETNITHQRFLIICFEGIPRIFFYKSERSASDSESTQKRDHES